LNCFYVVGGKWSLPCWLVWRHQSVRHSRKASNDYAKRHTTRQTNPWRARLIPTSNNWMTELRAIASSSIFSFCGSIVFIKSRWVVVLVSVHATSPWTNFPLWLCTVCSQLPDFGYILPQFWLCDVFLTSWMRNWH